MATQTIPAIRSTAALTRTCRHHGIKLDGTETRYQMLARLASKLLTAGVNATQSAGDTVTQLDADRLARLVAEYLNAAAGDDLPAAAAAQLSPAAAAAANEVTIKITGAANRTAKLAGGMHHKLPEVIQLAAAGMPVMLVGPTGSGKTHLAGQLAKAMELGFTFNSMSAGVTESHLLGRVLPDANGEWGYQASPFAHTFGHGGVHLFDEVDAADPNLMVIINAAIANGKLALPFNGAEPIERHENTVLVCAANTFGTGPTAEYVGRNALDAATLNRFSVSTVEIDYDRDLERKLATGACGDAASKLLDWAWETRDKIDNAKLRRSLSTRTIVDASKLRQIGRSIDSIRDAFLMGWSIPERQAIGVAC